MKLDSIPSCPWWSHSWWRGPPGTATWVSFPFRGWVSLRSSFFPTVPPTCSRSTASGPLHSAIGTAVPLPASSPGCPSFALCTECLSQLCPSLAFPVSISPPPPGWICGAGHCDALSVASSHQTRVRALLAAGCWRACSAPRTDAHAVASLLEFDP